MGDAQIRANFALCLNRMHGYTKKADFATATFEDIQVRLSRLETVWKQFDDENTKVLLNLTTAEDADKQLNEDIYEKAETDYLSAKVQLTKKLNEFQKAAADIANSSTISSADHEAMKEGFTITIPNNRSSATGLQLMPAELPIFSGDYAEWPTFRNLYLRLVHDDSSMFPLAKFNQLDRHLKSEPASLIAGIQRNDENYVLAWDTIKSAYDNPQLIVNELLDQLNGLQALNEENPAQLRLITTRYRQVTRQLTAANIDVSTWDPLLTYQLADLLDPMTRRDWELQRPEKETVSLEKMLKFMEVRITALQNVSRSSRRLKSVIVQSPYNQNQRVQSNFKSRNSTPTVALTKSSNAADNSNSKKPCAVCKSKIHEVPECDKFEALNCLPRMARARSLRLCFGCLSPDHNLPQCNVPICPYCKSDKRHHKLLCFEYCDKVRDGKPLMVAFMQQVIEETLTECEVLLATAIVTVLSESGNQLLGRALCDNGGQANLITEEFVRKLRTSRRNTISAIRPVGDGHGINVRGIVTLTIKSTIAPYQITIDALVTRRISSMLPSSEINIGEWPEEVTNNLADPTLEQPGEIDLLLGSQVWAQILNPSIQRNNTGLIAQDSQFGWLILGGLLIPTQMPFVGVVQLQDERLSDVIQRFWELESVSEQPHRSAEQQFCANVLENETYREETGRYVASIPINPNAALLGNSRSIALKRFFQIENRFARDPEYHREYDKFMKDYIDRGHMSLVTTPINPTDEHYFIPHHGILSERKNFRVVFDGSAPTSSGQSLNDIQMKGERLQDNLIDIILRFRLHRIGLTADIQQMYRQILINPDQRNLQLVFYRTNPLEEIKVYQLNTVTYGLKHAPHTSVGVLQLCARDHMESHPVAAAVALQDYYMDDLTTGGDEPEEVIDLYHQMKSMMSSGGFKLRKWATNNWNVLSQFDIEDLPNTQPIDLFEELDVVRSVLGTFWNPMTDEFMFTIKELDTNGQITKRTATSELAKLFDPTGLLAAVIARGKLLIRQIWLSKSDWDDTLADPILTQWKTYFSSLKHLENVRIPRWIGTIKTTYIELHGFGDASESLYAAVVYHRTLTSDGLIKTGILTAKTRVAPLKTISIPRLELCAALLLSRLMASVKNVLKHRTVNCHYWSDSRIVLAWLEQSPHTLKTFVANRVSEIQESTKNNIWRHVPTSDNPADIAYRGIDGNDLINHELWWNGPTWLPLNSSEWPGDQSIQQLTLTETEMMEVMHEQKPPVIAMIKLETFWIATKFSSFSKLCLVTAFIMRSARNCKTKVTIRKATPDQPEKKFKPIEDVDPLKRFELESAERFWLAKCQEFDFPNEIKQCRNGADLPRSSKLFGMQPFLDESGILRVGGRLKNAWISYATKYPIILDGHSPITRAIIKKTHIEMLHGGYQLTTRTMRERFWTIAGRNAIRSVIHNCIQCVTIRGKTCTQKMADLVEERVIPQKPFTNVSLDYCGPFEVKRFPGRCRTLVKAYVAVFVCMATRAIHLEVVNDLTSDAFIDSYQRFAARRGHCARIISDNAKTFTGAKRKLNELADVFHKSSHSSFFSIRGIEWKFIMPCSPSQGGSHESAVKLFKHHFKRVMSTNVISLIEMQSLTTRIEGCLNSRPLAVQTEEATDHVIITPAMLVTGHSLTVVPPVEPLLLEEPITNHHLRKIQYWHQHIWRLWQSDYINNLQCRGRWQTKQPNLEVDDIVLIKEDNLAPQHWALAQITEVHPGKDGNVRNVSLKVSSGKIFQRAVQKLCKLPVVGQDVMATP